MIKHPASVLVELNQDSRKVIHGILLSANLSVVVPVNNPKNSTVKLAHVDVPKVPLENSVRRKQRFLNSNQQLVLMVVRNPCQLEDVKVNKNGLIVAFVNVQVNQNPLQVIHGILLSAIFIVHVLVTNPKNSTVKIAHVAVPKVP